MNQDDDLDRLFRTALQRDTAGWQAPSRSASAGIPWSVPVSWPRWPRWVWLRFSSSGARAARPAGRRRVPHRGRAPPVVGTSPSTLPATATPYAVPVGGGRFAHRSRRPGPARFRARLRVGPSRWDHLAPGHSTLQLRPVHLDRSQPGRGAGLGGHPAPRTPLSGYRSATGVSQLLFANAEDGWAYGPELWSTTTAGLLAPGHRRRRWDPQRGGRRRPTGRRHRRGIRPGRHRAAGSRAGHR